MGRGYFTVLRFFFSFLPIRRLKRKRGELDLHLFKYSLVTGVTQATVGATCSFFYRSRFVDLFSMTFINVLLIFRPFQCSWYRRRQAGRRGRLWAEAGSRPRFNFSQLGRGKPLASAGWVVGGGCDAASGRAGRGHTHVSSSARSPVSPRGLLPGQGHAELRLLRPSPCPRPPDTSPPEKSQEHASRSSPPPDKHTQILLQFRISLDVDTKT